MANIKLDNIKLENLPELVLAATTLLYGEKDPYTALADAGKITLSLLDDRYRDAVNAIQFDLSPIGSVDVGQIQWNSDDGTLEIGLTSGTVVLQLGQENHIYSINKSGFDIINGDVVTLVGSQSGRPSICLSDANDPPLCDSAVGLATEDILNNDKGYVTTFGLVRGIKTNTWSEGDRLWLSNTPGVKTLTPPDAPSRKVFIGVVLVDHPSDGSMFISPVNVPNLSLLSDVYVPSLTDKDTLHWVSANSRWEVRSPSPSFKSQMVTTQGLGANPDVFAFGAYEFSTTKITLTQASLTQAFGSANVTSAAHSFIVAGGSGVVDTGVVGLRVNGTSITDAGVRTVGDSETLSADITTLSLNDYVEGKKWLGIFTYELFVVSGAPVNYSLDFNYGFAKYDDWGNRDFIITNIEIIGLAGANDNDFDVKLIHHESGDWIYAVAGFTPTSAGHVITSLVGDHATDDKLVNGKHFFWKRSNLSQAIVGSGSEGFLVLVSSSANNAVEYCNIHVGATL